jgi:bifunctional non-homologous end joining protein LigD
VPSLLPPSLAPMKATSGDLPQGDGWVHEPKWDGMRVLAFVEGDRVRLQSVNLLDVTAGWPELDALPGALGVRAALLDGELVALDERGRPSFGRLQQRMHVGSRAEALRRAAAVPVAYVVFDLLHLDEHPLLELPLVERRRLLERLLEAGPTWQLSPQHDDGAALYDAAAANDLEGVMSKRRDSPYEPGRRSRLWRKVKVRRRQEVVVGGWLPGEGGRAGRMGALLVGVHDAPGGPLRFAGRVGTGFSDAELERLAGHMAGLAQPDCPFDPPPPRADLARGATWLRPELVVEVAFGEWTADGRLRHPSYLGERIDVDPARVVREPG